MNDSQVQRFSGWPTRALLAGALILSVLLGGGCDLFRPSPPPCTKIDATVAYYYRYKDAMPDHSDIAYIEVLPAGPRCVVLSPKKAPVFPDGAVSGFVKDGAMKIDIPEAKDVQILGKASIAVYYAGPASSPSPTPVAVENLDRVSRTIETVSVIDKGTPACGGGCPAIPCDGYSCCKRPPCP